MKDILKGTSKGFGDSLNMRILEAEKEIVVTIGSKISALPAEKTFWIWNP